MIKMLYTIAQRLLIVLVFAGCAHSASVTTEPALPVRPAETTAQLESQARCLIASGKDAEALRVVNQILAGDPHNAYARRVRPLLAEIVTAHPPAQLPKQNDVHTQSVLDRPTPELTFDSVSFGEALGLLHDAAGVDIFTNWDLLAAAGFSREAKVTLHLRNTKLSKALSILLDSVGGEKTKLGYTLDGGVITISTFDDLARYTIVRVYDIRDIVPAIVDPDSDDDPIPTTMAAGSGAQTQAAPGRMELIDQVTKLIEDCVEPESWKEAGGKYAEIHELGGRLIIVQSPECQRLVADLIEQLRESRAIQPAPEAGP